MKKISFAAAAFTISASLVHGQARPPVAKPAPPPTPPPVIAGPRSQPVSEPFTYDQKPVAGSSHLVTAEQAQSIINRFKEAYPKMGNPRILIYVNRELVDQKSGLKLSARRDQREAVRGDFQRTIGNQANATNAATTNPTSQSEKVSSKNTYRINEKKEAPLADQQTVRDVERMFGRAFRLGGATIVDQSVATQLIADRHIDNFATPTEGELARKEREAVGKVADVVLEVLISSRQVNVPEISGDRTYTIPDIQATAIRVRDSKIIGQATASDFVGPGSPPRVVRSFGPREITEATALSLMEDMLATQ